MSRSALTDDVRRVWYRRFPDYGRCRPVIRYLTGGGCARFVVIFHPSRERLQAIYAAGPAVDEMRPLDAVEPEATLRFGRWLVTPNRFPVLEGHILLVLEEHLATPTVADVLDAMRFARETGYRLLLNLHG